MDIEAETRKLWQVTKTIKQLNYDSGHLAAQKLNKFEDQFGDKISLPEAINLLRTWRKSNCRKSEAIVHLWQVCFSPNIAKLCDEKQLIMEQVCVAALDTCRFDIARVCISELLREFPRSLRVKKYRAMLMEAEERYDEAVALLDALIEEDNSNTMLRKRKVAILKAQGRTSDAIKELVEYLRTFMADTEAWQELSELYIAEQDFVKAAFCVEELILHGSDNHLLHQRYAEIRYTMGGLENMELAKNYYCHAVKLNPNNLRSLYGLFSAASNLASSQKVSAAKKRDAAKLGEITMVKIQQHYRDKQVEYVKNMLSPL